MIAFIEGTIDHLDPAFVVLNVHGVGYEIRISLNTYSSLKGSERTKLFTHLHIKEDAHTLYGFFEYSEKLRFQDLISISGVGPGTSIMVLSSLGPDELAEAIVSEDVRTIQSVKGIGGKTAQRIILELKDKMKKRGLLDDKVQLVAPVDNTVRDQALSALVTLGIGKGAAEKSVDTILKSRGRDITLEELIKLALKSA